MAKKEMRIIEKIEDVIKTPEKFFNSVKSEKSIKPAFIFDAVITAVYVAASYIISLAVGGPLLSGAASGVTGVVINWAFDILFTFVFAGYFHLFIRLLGGKGKYLDTYKVYAYASAVFLPLLAVMALLGLGTAGIVIGVLIGIAICIWGLYVYLKGLSVLHKMSMLRAFGALCVASIVAAVILFVLFIIFLLPIVMSSIAAA